MSPFLMENMPISKLYHAVTLRVFSWRRVVTKRMTEGVAVMPCLPKGRMKTLRETGVIMWRSRYTVVVDGEAGERLLYNTATGAFAALDQAAFSEFEAGGGALADELALAGFLTELAPEEELAAQQAKFDAIRADR